MLCEQGTIPPPQQAGAKLRVIFQIAKHLRDFRLKIFRFLLQLIEIAVESYCDSTTILLRFNDNPTAIQRQSRRISFYQR